MSNQLSVRILLVILLALAATPVSGQQRRVSSNSLAAQQSANETAPVVFRSARDLITDGEWARAQEKFREYVNSYPNEKNLDAALYWMAYAQNKLERFDQCRETIARLLEKYPSSAWRDDARTLLAQVPGALAAAATVDQALAAERLLTTIAPAARPSEVGIIYAPGVASTAPLAITPLPSVGIAQGIAATAWNVDELARSEDDNDPCEFKIVVLQALFQTDVQRGIMAATDWLKPGSNQTVRCKGAALSLLGHHGGKTVTPVILNFARTETDIKLRARAISALGATNDESVIDPLRDFALNSTENEIVEASLYALSRHTNDRVITVLSDIAISGKTPAQRKVAIASIASRAGDPAVDALLRIYDADQSIEIRKSVIAGFANRKSERAGQKLFDIARSADNVELRKAAIGGISRRGGDKAVDFLLNLYDTEKDEAVKDQIINALGGSSFNLGGAVYAAAGQNVVNVAGSGARLNDQRVVRKLIDIAKNPQAPMERRKRAIGWLSRSKDPEVLKFLEELLK